MGIPSPKNRKNTTFPFHVFDRYAIHIQAFANVFDGQFIIFNHHLHKIFLKYIFKLYIRKICVERKYISKKNISKHLYIRKMMGTPFEIFAKHKFPDSQI